MADAKPPTRPPVAPARRSRVRDPRVDSSPPSSESSAAYFVESPIDEVSEARPKGGPVSRTSRAVASLGPSSSDTQAVLAQLAALEEEMILLRDQKEKDEAMLGQMLARVADREQEAREARGETQRFEERATIAEMKVAAIEAEMADLDRAAMEPLPGGALEEAEAATRASELEEALAKVAKLEEALAKAADPSREHGAESGKPARKNSAELDIARAKTAEAEVAYARIAVLEDALRSAHSSSEEAESRAKELEAKLASTDARAREVSEDRETATLVAADLAEKVETLESRLEAAETVGRAAVEAKEAAESQAGGRLDRIGELESALVVREGRLDAAEMHLEEAKESAALAEERVKALASELAAANTSAGELTVRTEGLAAELAKANASAGELTARIEGLAAELAKARGTIEDAAAHARNLENDFADRTKELVSERAERRASEGALKKRHEESLGQQKAMFERQLEGLEGQLAEAKAAKEKVELSFKEFRGRSQEMQAEVASLEERLAIAVDERATLSRQAVTMKGDADRLAADLHVARRELAHGRELVTRFSLAMMQLEKIDHDAVALRERLFNETRQAVLSLPSPVERATAPRVEAPPSAQAPAAANRQASPATPSGGESEVSFASVAPPPSGQLRAVAPLLRAASAGEKTAGRTGRMASEPPPLGPTSDSEIRISVDEEGWDEGDEG